MRKKGVALCILFLVIAISGFFISPRDVSRDVVPVSPPADLLKLPFVGVGPALFSYANPAISSRIEPGSITYTFSNSKLSPLVIKENLPDARFPEGQDLSKTTVNYFIGNDPEKWKSGLPAFNAVRYSNLWPGIDMVLEPRAEGIEKLITVAPQADPSVIRFELEGVTLSRESDGSLLLTGPTHNATLSAPRAYQMINGERRDVSIYYVLGEEQVSNSALLLKSTNEAAPSMAHTSYGFSLGAYDINYPLEIDPLIASTYLGSSGQDQVSFIIRDSSSGSIFVGGGFSNSDFPTTPGAYETTNVGSQDLFVARFSADLSTLEAATYLGGTDFDHRISAAALSGGSLYIGGITFSVDFPTTGGAFMEAPAGGGVEGFVSKLSLDLGTLQASTYIGGSDEDAVNGLGVDGSHVYISGDTKSNDFATSTGAYQEDRAGGVDSFVMKLSSNLATLEASTYLGGTGNESGILSGGESRTKLSFGGGSVYVAGDTTSLDFPVTLGAYQAAISGTQDYFVSKLSSDLTTLEASTYLGGATDEYFATVGFYGGSVYVAGTSDGGFPVTSSAYQQTYAGGSEAVVSKLSSDLTTLEASTYFGGSSNDFISATHFSFVSDGIYVPGATLSTDFPLSPLAYLNTTNGNQMGFVIKLSLDLATLDLSTYLGGTNPDGSNQAMGVALDSSENVYIAGVAASTDFPTTLGAYDTTANDPGEGVGDIYVAYFNCNVSYTCATDSPLVSSQAATDVAETSFVANGTIDDTSGEPSTARGFVYGTSGYTATTTESGSFSVPSTLVAYAAK